MPFILSLFLILFSLETRALVVVSDFDDTIKITNAGNLAAATYNGFFKTKVYTGMPELLSEMRAYTEELHIVSAAPSLVAPRIRNLLRKQKIAYESLSYRLLRSWEDKIQFKLEAIEEVLKRGEEIILLGDDVEKDPEIFQEIQQRYPGKVLAAYIHQVRSRKLPPGVIPYYTSFDLALHEFLAGRMAEAGVQQVLASFGAAPSLKRTFPGFTHCPSQTEKFEWQQATTFNKDASELSDRIIAFCSKRSVRVK